jgi:SprT protein
MKQDYIDLLPTESISLIQKWVAEIDVVIKVVKARKTKLGDFRYSFSNKCIITINDDLNPFSFLITLTHEIAHAFVYEEFKGCVASHGKEWKEVFKGLMLNFLPKNIFPNDIMTALSIHLMKPSASSCNDFNLSSALKKYDKLKKLNVSDIKLGELFVSSNRVFIKGHKLRKRFKCKEIKTNRIYLFNPLANIDLVKQVS